AHDEHTPFLDDIPAYALGALDAEEAAALESHLRTCASCRDELAGYRLVSDSLLTAVPPKPPSAALRKRLQNRLPGGQKQPRPRLAWTFSQWPVGLAFAVLLILNIFTLVQLQGIRTQQAGLLHQVGNAQVALAMLSYPGVQTLPVSGENVSGTLLLDADRNTAVLVAWNLPELPAGQTYQVWLVEPDGGRVSAGIFRPESGQPYTTETIASAQILSSFVGIGVTIEPAGGSDQPTGERVLKVDF
ncbi:MAG: anti-sigma factor, partial [Chloroflexota bacterium]